MKRATDYFTPATFTFLRKLARNNEREWFNAHKHEYLEYVRDPFLHLIDALREPLQAISPHYVADARPMGGSLFRVYRDTRFSNEKIPYKTWAGARFWHERRREVPCTPVFYLHIAPKNCFLGGGLWHPDPESLKRVREYLLNNPASWDSATRTRSFRDAFSFGGESLARPPRGYDAAHPYIEDLKRKDWVAMANLDDEVVLRADLPKIVGRHFRKVAPMIDWLCGALDLDF